MTAGDVGVDAVGSSSCTDARDVVIQTQITGDVDAEQTNMAAGSYNVRF